MRKIIFVNRFYYPDVSATSQMLSDLAPALVQRGLSVAVVTSKLRYDGSSASLAANDTHEGVAVRRVRTSRFGRGWLPGRMVDYLSFYLSAVACLLVMARRGDIIVAKTDPPLLSVACRLVAVLRGARLVVWLQDIFPEIAERLGIPLPRPVSRVLRWLRDRSLRAADLNVVIGHRMNDFVRGMGVPGHKLEVSPNWSPVGPAGDIGSQVEALRADWGLGDAFVIGYSGNMGRAHEFESIVDAIARLRDRDDLRFLFIGDGARRPWLEDMIAQRDLQNCLLKPYQPRSALAVTLALPNVHLVSLAPDLEGLLVPSKLYGILAAGKAVLNVGDPEGEVGQTLARHGCGMSVPPGDGAALAKAIVALAADAEFTRRAGVQGFEAFSRCYSLEVAVNRWERMLRGIA